MPLISIITTVYDAKDYLPLTVKSILAQTFTDFELILVEDGSPNGCGELCDELAKTDGRIRVVHKPNGGPASAANAGLDAATGRYISYVDSDDLLEPDFLETLYNMVTESGCPLAACGAECIDEEGNRLGRGGGYYDRFLSLYHGAMAMVCREQLMCASIPTEDHDIPVPWLVTEAGVFPGRAAAPENRHCLS